MKYYKKINNYPEPDLTDFNKWQPCWTCQNCYGGCNWSIDFTPVDGWIAIPVHIKSNGEFADTYKIVYCPEYKKEIRK